MVSCFIVGHEVVIIFLLSDLVTRPVLIIGPLADAVLDKLASDYPHKYARCEPKRTNWSQEVRLFLLLFFIAFVTPGVTCTQVEFIANYVVFLRPHIHP